MAKATAPKSGNGRDRAAPTTAQRRLAAERAAAARERIAQAQRRRQLMLVGGSVLGVVVIVAVLIIVKVTTGAGGPSSGQKATTASESIVQKIASVPAATLNAIGAGTAATPPSKISAPALTSGGKPEIFYAGAEYCPFCAAERWAMAVAVSRFGTLHGVGQTASSSSDVYPSTQTLSFHGATLTSNDIVFVAKELESNQVVGNSYAPLDKLDAAQQAVFDKYNNKPYVSSPGSIPFVDIGGKYVISGASYDPQVLQGKTHAQIADALSDPSSPIAKAVDGTANLITAAICASSGNQPSAVCTSAGVTAAAAKLAGS